MKPDHRRSSRQRYHGFVEDYKNRRLDDATEAGKDQKQLGEPAGTGDATTPPAEPRDPSKRRERLREYLRWLRPNRYAVGIVLLLAMMAAGLEMIEPLFMRYIIDKVLLNTRLDTPSRLSRLQLAGIAFLVVVIGSNLIGAIKDYRQRLLNNRVMVALRHSLFERLLHLPLPKLWDMKTGGIISRLTGDVETTTGLLQMAVVSPSVSVIRLIIAVVVLLSLNW